MKKFSFVVFILLLLGGSYFYLNKYNPAILQNIWQIVYEYTPEENIESNNQFDVYLNDDLNSNIPVVLKWESGVKLAAFTKNKKLVAITVETKEGKIGLIQLNKDGLPDKFSIEGNIAVFRNYTESTVDIFVTYKNGVTEVFKNSHIMPQQYSFNIIQTAYAIETQGVLHEIGIAMNVISCGVGLTSMFVSAGATTPVAFMGCAALAIRYSSWNANFGDCTGDFIYCAGKLTIEGKAGDSIVSTTGDMYDTFFPSGVKLIGVFRNSVSQNPIEKGTLSALRKNSQESLRGEWKEDGRYEILFKNGGVYALTAFPEGYVKSSFHVSLSDSKIQIRIPNRPEVFEKLLSTNSLQEIEIDFFIEPDAFISGEVIDSENGNPINEATIELLDGKDIVAKTFTELDGLFDIQPPIGTEGKSFTLQVSADDYSKNKKSYYVSYDVKIDSDEYELENWTGVVKMKKGNGFWLMTPKSKACSDLFGHIRFVIEDEKPKGIKDPACTKKFCMIYDLEGRVSEYGSLDFTHTLGSFLTISETSFHFKGALDGEKGNGTWNVIVNNPGNKMTAEEKAHWATCDGTWEAVKITF